MVKVKYVLINRQLCFNNALHHTWVCSGNNAATRKTTEAKFVRQQNYNAIYLTSSELLNKSCISESEFLVRFAHIKQSGPDVNYRAVAQRT